MAAPDLEAAMALAANPWWAARGWLTLLYFAASLIAVLVACWKLRERHPLLVLVAGAFFLMASTLDLAFRAQQLFVVFGAWGERFSQAKDPAEPRSWDRSSSSRPRGAAGGSAS